MSSPVTKLNRFSRLFSPTNLNSPRDRKASTNSNLDPRTPELPLLPEECERHVETPSSNRSPTLCSTPANECKNDKLVFLAGDQQNCHDNLSFQKLRTNLDKLKQRHARTILKTSTSLRNRRFGVSENIALARLQGSHKKTLQQSNRGKCSVFSASLIPSLAQCQRSTQILRLSGITISPNSVSWASQSPFSRHPDDMNETPSSECFAYSFEQGPGAPLHHVDVEMVEQCPPEKLYYWEENEGEIKMEESIGNGGFGQVFKGTYRGERVAIKKLLRAYRSRQIFVETFLGEIQALRLRHANIVRTFVVIQSNPLNGAKTPSSCYVVMEHAGDRNLSQVINSSEEIIPETRRNKFCFDILNGLRYLHLNQLAHLDLKPSNVIVTPCDSCKICDFGSCFPVKSPKGAEAENVQNGTRSCDSAIGSSLVSAQISSSSNKSGSQLMGTFQYRAPELLRGYLPTFKADIYSFSITAWQIWSRVFPYAGQHYHTAVYGVVALGLRPPISNQISDTICTKSTQGFFDLLVSCWQAEPNQRPPAEEAIGMLKNLEIY